MERPTNLPKIYKGPVGPLVHRCQTCAETGPQLIRCGGCHAVRYCSVEHQAADLPKHRTACDTIKKTISNLAKQEHRIHNPVPNVMVPDVLMPDLAPEADNHGDVIIPDARDYVGARLELAMEQLVPLGTLDSLNEALDHIKEVRKMCHGDEMGFSSFMPPTMLRLDLDQEYYDLVKHGAISFQRNHLIRLNPPADPPVVSTTSSLTIEDADVYEDPEFLGGAYNLRPVIAVLLLKLKLLVDVINTKAARKVLLQTSLPSKIQKLIEPLVVRSPLSASLHMKTLQSLSELEAKLLKQIQGLGGGVNMFYKSFLFFLLKPDEVPVGALERSPFGRQEYMTELIQTWYSAWWETEGVLDLLANARKCATQAMEGDLHEAMANEGDSPGTTPRLTAKEALEIQSIDRLWEFLPYAVEDASYLGPWSERPSMKHLESLGKGKGDVITPRLFSLLDEVERHVFTPLGG